MDVAKAPKNCMLWSHELYQPYKLTRFCPMDVTKPYKLIGFGAITKPYTIIRFGAMDVTKPSKCIRFGAMDVTKSYKFICFGGCHQTL